MKVASQCTQKSGLRGWTESNLESFSVTIVLFLARPAMSFGSLDKIRRFSKYVMDTVLHTSY